MNSDGESFKLGDKLVQKDLANTLRSIAENGKKGFYEGEIADKIANDIKSKTINESKDIAKIEADKIIKQAENLIQAEKNAVINDLKDQVAELSINIAEKVLKDELNNKVKHEKLVERLLKESNIK